MSSSDKTQSDLQNKSDNSRRTVKAKRFLANCFVGSYIYLPIAAVIIWFFGLIILLFMWIQDGKPRYNPTQASIAFISFVGAAYPTLFICICVPVVLLYFPTICIIRYLRHKNRLPGTVQRKEKIYSWLAIAFCGLGCMGLLILSIWNCWDYYNIHWCGTFLFIIGVSLSAIFQTAEVWCLKKEHPDRKHLKRNGIAKLSVVGLPIILACAFGGFYSLCRGNPTSEDGEYTPEQCEKYSSTAAIMEWSIAFSLNLYFITLVIDLWPSRKTSSRYIRREEGEEKV
ncbi:hypothetical protein L486_01350 [Kwoniella mangroviensis CBS 10435]|uniref:CWH43-like N-terminal domain-containing protein n=1 Tax=Kwoniella mangroviensis CBS 10435 TaxID=1331196 RepID=A0A1B9J1M8_9TREE|nr:uncharacterized protein I203_03986 [Kwoniella mangroviensis CBS 8507]OCF61692.1 hypothetical protein L486_01350 [Kwoniella mangroviensis CBS 10435]OCF67296.1 hypothetical protein I203_03986 [Kwoniella mangroviensis CBS 8507]